MRTIKTWEEDWYMHLRTQPKNGWSHPKAGWEENYGEPSKKLNYLKRELNVSPKKFGKLVIIPPQGKGTYKKKSEYGVAMIYFNNVKLKREILKTIDNMRSRS